MFPGCKAVMVADGAGQVWISHLGATMMIQALFSHLHRLTLDGRPLDTAEHGEDLLRSAVTAANQDLIQMNRWLHAQQYHVPITTTLIVIETAGFFHATSFGDGDVLHYQGAATEPTSLEAAIGTRRFLGTQVNPLVEIYTVPKDTPDGNLFVLFTDGAGTRESLQESKDGDRLGEFTLRPAADLIRREITDGIRGSNMVYGESLFSNIPEEEEKLHFLDVQSVLEELASGRISQRPGVDLSLDTDNRSIGVISDGAYLSFWKGHG
jgi:hypothetical protein